MPSEIRAEISNWLDHESYWQYSQVCQLIAEECSKDIQMQINKLQHVGADCGIVRTWYRAILAARKVQELIGPTKFTEFSLKIIFGGTPSELREKSEFDSLPSHEPVNIYRANNFGRLQELADYFTTYSISNPVYVLPLLEVTCPLTGQSMQRPWVLLEDGMTYEKEEIIIWLIRNRNISPNLEEITSATLIPTSAILIPNCALAALRPNCPLTNKPFLEPYICLDGHTYEKEAIISEIRNQARAQVETYGFLKNTFISPANGRNYNFSTIYLNKSLMAQRDELLEETINPISISDYYREFDESACVFDEEIRSIFSNRSDESWESFIVKVKNRRSELGLPSRCSDYCNQEIADLSNLDLSNLELRDLSYKACTFFNTNFNNARLIFGTLSNCNFISCSFVNTNFSEGIYFDGLGSYFSSNFLGAKFNNPRVLGAKLKNGNFYELFKSLWAVNTYMPETLTQNLVDATEDIIDVVDEIEFDPRLAEISSDLTDSSEDVRRNNQLEGAQNGITAYFTYIYGIVLSFLNQIFEKITLLFTSN